MPPVARWIPVVLLALSPLTACSGGAGDPDLGILSSGPVCRYKDFRGKDATCVTGGQCPSRDGCNVTYCQDGGAAMTFRFCGCDISPHLVNGSDQVSYGTHTADDGCTVCTCGKDTGGPFLESGFTCDSSACK